METSSFQILFYWIDLLNTACTHAHVVSSTLMASGVLPTHYNSCHSNEYSSRTQRLPLPHRVYDTTKHKHASIGHSHKFLTGCYSTHQTKPPLPQVPPFL